jgi:hypothetical protein
VKNEVALLLEQLANTYPGRADDVRELLLDAGLTDKEIDKQLRFSLGRPELDVANVPLLAPDKTRPLTAMLKARFNFASAIHDVSEHFLSLKEMSAFSKKQKFKKIFKAQAEHWEGSAPATVPLERLSLFSVSSLDDGDLTYLVWPVKKGEPQVWKYAGQSETKYTDLAEYLRFLCDAA